MAEGAASSVSVVLEEGEVEAEAEAEVEAATPAVEAGEVEEKDAEDVAVVGQNR